MMVTLIALLLSAPTVVTIRVDIRATTPISPYIYGCNFPDWEAMRLPFSLVRMGGNRLTAYNWETNASNAGNDWHHQNDGLMGESNEAGITMKRFLDAAQKHHATALLTVPTAGYVAADKNGDGDVNKTPDYLNKRFIPSYARKPGGKFSYPPNPDDRAVYQDEFVAWIDSLRTAGSQLWFSLDNEPDLWHSTHARIHPQPVTYREVIANSIEFGTAIKAAAPKALVFGPVNYGFMGFRTLQNAADAQGRDFLDTYMDAMQAEEKRAGRRILDVLDIHWYPEAKGDGVRVAFGDDRPGTPAARIQAPRSLWDPDYVEESWIANFLGKKPIILIPTLQKQIAQHYPGTKLGITEYDFGGGSVISGALAQADVLGIFGRYGVFAACHFGLEAKDTAQLAGFRAFLNYDSAGSGFGDRELGVFGCNPQFESVYASIDSRRPGKVILVVINKTDSPRQFRFEGLGASTGTGWTTTGPDFVAKKQPVATAKFVAPPLSVTTMEVKGDTKR